MDIAAAKAAILQENPGWFYFLINTVKDSDKESSVPLTLVKIGFANKEPTLRIRDYKYMNGANACATAPYEKMLAYWNSNYPYEKIRTAYLETWNVECEVKFNHLYQAINLEAHIKTIMLLGLTEFNSREECRSDLSGSGYKFGKTDYFLLTPNKLEELKMLIKEVKEYSIRNNLTVKT